MNRAEGEADNVDAPVVRASVKVSEHMSHTSSTQSLSLTPINPKRVAALVFSGIPYSAHTFSGFEYNISPPAHRSNSLHQKLCLSLAGGPRSELRS